jgi:hypothetical protein
LSGEGIEEAEGHRSQVWRKKAVECRQFSALLIVARRWSVGGCQRTVTSGLERPIRGWLTLDLASIRQVASLVGRSKIQAHP